MSAVASRGAPVVPSPDTDRTEQPPPRIPAVRALGRGVLTLVVPGVPAYLAMTRVAGSGAPDPMPMVAFELVTVALCVVLAARAGLSVRSAVGARPGRGALVGLGAGAVRVAVFLALVPVVQPHDGLWPVVGSVLLQALLVVPAEELQFRGLLLGALASRWGTVVAVSASAVIFGAVHAAGVPPLVLIAVAADGVLFAALRVRARQLTAPAVAHLVVNLGCSVLLVPSEAVTSAQVLSYVLAVLAVDLVLAVALLRRAGPAPGWQAPAEPAHVPAVLTPEPTSAPAGTVGPTGPASDGAGPSTDACSESTQVLPPPPSILDLSDVKVFDVSDSALRYLVHRRGAAPLSVTPTALFLLRHARDRTPLPEIARELEARSDAPVRAADVTAGYARVLDQLHQVAASAPHRREHRIGMWARVPLLPQPVVRRLARPLTAAFGGLGAAVCVMTAGAGLAATLMHGAAHLSPRSIVGAYLLFLLSVIVHELGHSAAALRFGAEPSRIGFVMYLVWPSLYSDVTDVWRLSRPRRAAVDLGGVHLQLALGGLYGLAFVVSGDSMFGTAELFVLASVGVTLNPFFRFDGYWLLADALGVPDLATRGRVALLDAIVPAGTGWRRDVPRRPVAGRAWIRVVLVAYGALVALVWGLFGYLLLTGAWREVGDVPHNVVRVVQLDRPGAALLALAQAVIVVVVVYRLLGWAVRRIARHAGRPVPATVGNAVGNAVENSARP